MVAPAGKMKFYSPAELARLPSVNLFIHRPGRATAHFVETLLSDDGAVVRTFRHIHPADRAAFSRRFNELEGLGADRLVAGIGKILFYQEPFNILLLFEPGGGLLGSYSDIAAPLVRQPDGYHLTDWFLDVWIPAPGGLEVLDEDEFEAAITAKLLKPAEIQAAQQALQRLVNEYHHGKFPQNYLT
jgi:hypothetical protein